MNKMNEENIIKSANLIFKYRLNNKEIKKIPKNLVPNNIQDAYKIQTDVHAWLNGNLGPAEDTLNDLKDLYKSELFYGDYLVGNFIEDLKKADKYDDSIIIITADHGEFFGEHGEINHGVTVYNEVIRVPFLIKFPKNTIEPREINKLCSHYDLLPTLVNFLGLETDDNLFLDGKDILEEEENRSLVIDAPSLVLPNRLSHYPKIIERHAFFWRSYIDKNYKYVWKSDGTEYLYDRLKYEKEENNQIEEQKELAETMEDKMRKYYSQISNDFDINQYPINIGPTAAQFITSPRIIRELKKEGYL